MIQVTPSLEKASDYCTYCPKLCRFACPVADAEARETTTPWGLMSLVRAVRLDEVELTVEVGETFFHCVGCGRCQTYCRHDNDVAAGMLEARRWLVERGMALPEAVQGAPLHMLESGVVDGDLAPLPASAREVFAPDARTLYVPGCSRRSKDPEGVVWAGRVLHALLGEPVALLERGTSADKEGEALHCCGHALTQAGYEPQGVEQRARMDEAVVSRTLVVTECTHFSSPPSAERAPEEPRHFLEVLAEHLPAVLQRVEIPARLASKRVFYHDACQIGRRSGMYDTPRALIGAVLGRPPEELWLQREKALCCAARGHYASIESEGASAAARTLLEAARDSGAEVLITADPLCASHLGAQGGEAHKGESAGLPEIEVLDLVRLLAEGLGLLRTG